MRFVSPPRGLRPAIAAAAWLGRLWPSAANTSLEGRNRSAEFGTRSTLDARGDLDVHVGRHAGLQPQIVVGHVDDRRVGDDVLLHLRFEPHLRDRAAERFGRVGVDPEGDRLSGRMRPTSDSSRLATTCILVRSAASTNSVGACMLAATVWPTSTLREITRPSIGAVITVCSRFTWFWFSDGLRLCDLRLA